MFGGREQSAGGVRHKTKKPTTNLIKWPAFLFVLNIYRLLIRLVEITFDFLSENCTR